MQEVLWYAMGVGLVAYAITGGADFGGGIWDLLARGPRSAEQRGAIEHAIAPIWEANHVWLIFVIVVMFTAFPRAFAAIGIALHIPITLALIGIVLRGAAFTFRAYGLEPPGRRRLWQRVFAWSSAFTPVFLGLTLAAIASGEIRVDASGQVTSGFFAGWLSPFALAVGVFAAVLFAMLAAIYLCADTRGELQTDFRHRAIWAELIAGAVSLFTFWRAAVDAPQLFAGLTRPGGIGLQLATALAAVTTLHALVRGRFSRARIAAAVQVALVVGGFGWAMDDHLILPDLTRGAAGGHPRIDETVVVAMLLGAMLLLPSLWLLFRVFKARQRPE